MDFCDIIYENIIFSFDKPQIFQMLIIFLSQFIDVITQNAMLSRKVAYIIAKRFQLYYKNKRR